MREFNDIGKPLRLVTASSFYAAVQKSKKINKLIRSYSIVNCEVL